MNWWVSWVACSQDTIQNDFLAFDEGGWKLAVHTTRAQRGRETKEGERGMSSWFWSAAPSILSSGAASDASRQSVFSNVRDAVKARQDTEKGTEFRRYAKGSLVWIEGSEHIFRPAKVKKTFDKRKAGGQVVTKQAGKVKAMDLDEDMAASVHFMGKENLNCLGTMSFNLRDLSEPAIFHNIRLRFMLGHQFMNIGRNVLVFLNAEYETDILTLATLSDMRDDFREEGGMDEADGDASDDSGRSGMGVPKAELTDECKDTLSSVVDRSFRRLVDSGGEKSQTVMVSGPTVSGKRDVTKFVLLRAIQLARPTNAEWWRKILAADTLLQSCGGESYVRWTEIKVLFPSTSSKKKDNAKGKGDQQQRLVGSVYNAFGLDQACVTDTSLDMFPVFYNLVDAAYLHEKALPDKFNIHSPDKYRYMNRPSARPQKGGCSTFMCGRDVYGVSTHCDKHTSRCMEDDCEKPQLGDGFCIDHGEFTIGVPGPDVHPAESARAWYPVSEAMKTLNISEQQRNDLVSCFIGILDIGNFEFRDDPNQDPNEEPIIDENEQIDLPNGVDELLGVTARQLHNAFKVKTLVIKGETFRKVRPTKEKYFVRDGVARVVYGALFSWMLSKINSEVSSINEDEGQSSDWSFFSRKKPDSKKVDKTNGNVGVIGVLENATLQLKQSSLEDLYQNYRLERFHAFFAEELGKSVAKDVERVEGNKISLPVPSNEACLRLLLNSSRIRGGRGSRQSGPRGMADLMKRFSSKKDEGPSENSGGGGLGILELIEEEVISPGSSDKSLAGKIAKLSANPHLKNAVGMTFEVKHFGGRVLYNLEGFMDRVRSNAIPLEIHNLLREKSKIQLLQEALQLDQQKSRQAADEFEMNVALDAAPIDVGDDEERHRGHLQTARRIHAEVDRAIDILHRTQVEFILTIGANPEADPEAGLDPDFLLDQIRQMGITDAISGTVHNSLRGRGMNQKLFIRRYKCLRPVLDETATKVGLRKMSRLNLKKANDQVATLLQGMVASELIQGPVAVGDKSGSVFISSEAFFDLEALLKLARVDAANAIQRMSRQVLARITVLRKVRGMIRKQLRAGLDDLNRKELEAGIALAKKWRVAGSLLGIAEARLRNLERSDTLIASLEAAMKSKSAMEIYNLLQKFEKLGLTEDAFPIVGDALGLLKDLDDHKVTESDKQQMVDNFQTVADELRGRAGSFGSDSDEEYYGDENDEE